MWGPRSAGHCTGWHARGLALVLIISTLREDRVPSAREPKCARCDETQRGPLRGPFGGESTVNEFARGRLGHYRF